METLSHLGLLLGRRSATKLTEPGPTRAQLQVVLEAAGNVPDHGRLRPFRFLVAEGEGRARFGEALARVMAERSGLSEAKLAKVRAKAFRSPTLVALVASPKQGAIEIWEQHATAACAGYAVLLAAHALGIGAVWKSIPATRGKALSEFLGLEETEDMLGFIHLGQAPREPPPVHHPPFDLHETASILTPDGVRRWDGGNVLDPSHVTTE